MDFLVAAFVFALVWYTRHRYDRPGGTNDLKLFFLLWTLIPRQDSLDSSHGWRWRSHFLWKWYCSLQCAGGASLVIFSIYLGPRIYQKRQQDKVEIEELMSKIRLWRNLDIRYTSLADLSPLKTDLSLSQPMFFPCRTSHTRVFPKKHSFSYSYLLVGIPVGWRGKISSLLTADLKTLPWKGRKPKSGWFNIESADYLARGDSMHGLRGKLDKYLESQVSASCMRPMHTSSWP